jgi:hypothetical protein
MQEIANAVLPVQKKDGGNISHPYGYEAAADFSELLLSVFELTAQSDDIYFDVNQRIVSIFARFLDAALLGPVPDRNAYRNACEVLRCIFWRFGGEQPRGQWWENKLVGKLVGMLGTTGSFVNRQEAVGGRCGSRMMGVVLRAREFEARLRGRLLYGFCCLAARLPTADYELLDVLGK